MRKLGRIRMLSLKRFRRKKVKGKQLTETGAGFTFVNVYDSDNFTTTGSFFRPVP